MLQRWLHKIACKLGLPRQESDLDAYVRQGRRPWSRGYTLYKDRFITEVLANPSLLAHFRTGQPLPLRYGESLDDRVVEYPWLFSRLSVQPGRLLDAGSVLNASHLLEQPMLANKDLTLVTLAPESVCFWQKRISYVYADLRELPFRDHYFDEVISISTLEHVGKDNRIYTHEPRYQENESLDFLRAAHELKRVCKSGGKIFITVPFGRFNDFGWYQQFDANLLDRLIAAFAPAQVEETIFRYADGGWQFSTRQACAECEGFNIHATKYMDPTSTRDYDPDFAAASRANAALEVSV